MLRTTRSSPFLAFRTLHTQARSQSRRPNPRAMLLVLDFDKTLTQSDTLHLLSVAAQHARPHDKDSIVQTWKSLVDTYVTALAAHEKAFGPRRSFAAERAYLSSLSALEAQSLQRVAQSGVLAGVRMQHLQLAAESGGASLRKGWAAMLLCAARKGFDVCVLSVHWSGSFIRSVLANAVKSLPGDDAALLRGKMEQWDVVANELEGLEMGATGSIIGLGGGRGVHTSADKMYYFSSIVPGPEGRTMYVGDSVTDVECLMAADVGICMQGEEMGSGQRELSETLGRIGVRVLGINRNAEARKGEVLLFARDLDEVRQVLEFNLRIEDLARSVDA